ncbi:MAG TPA: hypothetical protein VFE15_02165 [Marmoricola sp.]|nr:hypothetical protein [Marmoricola sp.]
MTKRVRVLLLALVSPLLVVPVGNASADAPPTVTISTIRSTYTYGDSVELVFDINGTGPGMAFSVTVDGAKNPLIIKSSTTDGVRTAEAAAYVNFTVRAHVYDADGTTELATAVKTITVHAQLETTVLGYHGSQGRYTVFSRGASPKFESAEYPAAPGKRCLRHIVQRQFGSAWRNVTTSACKVEAKQGRVVWAWRGRHPSGTHFRVRPTFAGDQANLPSVGAWRYFRFR